MGYTTQFQGEIKITPELRASEIKFIQSMFGDMREWDAVEAKRLNFTWFNFEFNGAMDALRWDGSEKFYDADKVMEYLINRTVNEYPHLEFNGILQAQGEEFDDRWKLVVKKNKVSKVEVKIEGDVIECPDCGHKWVNGE